MFLASGNIRKWKGSHENKYSHHKKQKWATPTRGDRIRASRVRKLVADYKLTGWLISWNSMAPVPLWAAVANVSEAAISCWLANISKLQNGLIWQGSVLLHASEIAVGISGVVVGASTSCPHPRFCCPVWGSRLFCRLTAWRIIFFLGIVKVKIVFYLENIYMNENCYFILKDFRVIANIISSKFVNEPDL